MAGGRSGGKRSFSGSSNGGSKRRNPDERDSFVIDSEDTVYRYLVPANRIGSIIGKGGEIAKQLRADTRSKIRISDTVRGCEERVVTIYSSNDETNAYGDSEDYICPAQDALLRVHERVIAEELRGEEEEDDSQVTCKLLVPSDQIGAVIGKGGQYVQGIRTETRANIRILKDNHLPVCALETDELVQVTGSPAAVRKALFQIAKRLHENPSRSQTSLPSALPIAFGAGGGPILAAPGAPPILGVAPVVSPYGAYKGDTADWSHSLYAPPPREDSSPREFSIRLVCRSESLGGVIGRGGGLINEVRQKSGAVINLETSKAKEDCLITVSSKEFFDDHFSPTIEAVLLLQPRCSEKIERDSGLISYSTRLVVPSTRIGCLIGRGGGIITEIRRITKANIRIAAKDDVPKVAAEDDELVQISGDIDIAKDALLKICQRLRANIFDREGALPCLLPVLPYLPANSDVADGYSRDSRDRKRQGREGSYGASYRSGDYHSNDNYSSYGQPSIRGGSDTYGYSSYSMGRSGVTGASISSPPRRRSYY